MQSTPPYVEAKPLLVRIICTPVVNHPAVDQIAVPFKGLFMVQTGV